MLLNIYEKYIFISSDKIIKKNKKKTKIISESQWEQTQHFSALFAGALDT